MSRKIFGVLIAISALAIAPAAFATIDGSPHDQAIAAQGRSGCQTCHLPHSGTGGTRLWPVAETGMPAAAGLVGGLCGACHFGTTGSYRTVMTPLGANSEVYAYGAASHGMMMTWANEPGGNGQAAAAAAGMPYTSTTAMECTTCHDVHNDPSATGGGGFRPFLRASMETICQTCHPNRTVGSVTTFAGWGAANTGAGNATGSHPIGTDIVLNATDNNAPTRTTVDNTNAGLNAPVTNVGGGWVLGGHLFISSGTTRNAVGCNTCHAVHGRQWDPTDNTLTQPTGWTDAAPGANFLAIGQATGNNEGQAHSIANGDGGYNVLCEACHGVTTLQAGVATYFWNPGATNAAHPVDTSPLSSAAMANLVLPVGGRFVATEIPVGNISGATALPTPICESCHAAHPTANAWSRFANARYTDRGNYILRGKVELCNFCHNGTAQLVIGTKAHHPAGATTATYTNGGTTGIAPIVAAAAYLNLPAGSVLGCGTCHSEASTPATGTIHNWPTGTYAPAYLPMRAGWKPANNGRDNTGGLPATYWMSGAASGIDQPSTTCIDCHLGLTAGGASATNVTMKAHTGADPYDSAGAGSHFIGPVTAGFVATLTNGYGPGAVARTAGFNSITTQWVTAVTDSRSRYGGTAAAPIMVCESCHNVNPDRMVAGTKLLLFDSREGNLPAERSYFCEGCHSVPSGTHPLTGQTVTRTGAVLSTTSAYSKATWAQATTGKNSGVNCDSCHQAHSAATNGGSLILEVGADNVVPAVTQAALTTTTISGLTVANPIVNRRNQANNNVPDTTGYCNQCHAY